MNDRDRLRAALDDEQRRLSARPGLRGRAVTYATTTRREHRGLALAAAFATILAVSLIGALLYARIGQQPAGVPAGPGPVPSPAVSATPLAGPTPHLERASAAYDAARKQVVLFGAGQTWTFDSAAGWKQQHPTTSPPARTEAAMAYWPDSQSVVLFGGQSVGPAFTALQPLNDTWLWDGSNWHESLSTSRPPASVAPMLAAGDQLVLVLGDQNPVQTWTWSRFAGSWAPVKAAHAPSGPRVSSSLGFDAASKRYVLYGDLGRLLGSSFVPADTTTWLFDGGDWTSVAAPGPGARSGSSMATGSDGRVVLFGGADESAAQVASQRFFSDLWAWNGSGWSQLHPAAVPPVRAQAVLVSTPGGLILYGGETHTQNAASPLFDTWLYDGRSWREVSPG